MIREIIDDAAAENELSNPNSTWEWIKFMIKSATIQYSKQLKSTQMGHERELRDKYRRLKDEVDKDPDHELEELIRERVEGD